MMERKVLHITTQGAFSLGRQGENGVVEVHFPQSTAMLREEWQLNHRRATDTAAYPVALTKQGNDLVWLVSSGDTAVPGTGQAELTCYGSGGEVLKSMVYNTKVIQSLTTGEEVPDPVKPWYDSLQQAIGQKLDADQLPTAVDNALAQAKESGQFDGAPGEQGHPGTKGDKGDPGGITKLHFNEDNTITKLTDEETEDLVEWEALLTMLETGIVILQYNNSWHDNNWCSVVEGWYPEERNIRFYNWNEMDYTTLAVDW